ncbi:MAG: nitrate reductase molybdenum cofactor assembly chaperone [Acidobacteria bacterium]|nr:nitrate reductase molybdenum cofactor assembly chaperone [Acidobacteriota bacterium]
MLLDTFANLLRYPGHADVQEAARALLRLATEEAPETAARIGRFIDATGSLSREEMEELYTRTFDINPLVSLEVGWHLFGENYDRGRFLVAMRQQLRLHHIAETTELPDHLTSILSLVARLEPAAAARFAEDSVVPALEKMLAGLKDKGNPYENILEAVRSELEKSCTAPEGALV